MKKNNADKILDEYQKELKKFFEGKESKSFDAITSEMLEKIKNEGKKIAENIETETKKKR